MGERSKYERTWSRSRRDPCDHGENEISKIRYLNKPALARTPGTPEDREREGEERQRETDRNRGE